MQSQILPSRAALVDRIALQFEYGQNLIVLLGSSGLGKSYLLETFITDKYNDFNKAFVKLTARMNDAQLMTQLLEQSFNTPLIDDTLSLSENFYQLLKQQPCGPCLWVLDDAKHLSEEIQLELELLAKNSPVTLYIMIASQSKLPISRAIEIHLESLNISESKQLMSWYFPNLPYDEDPIFKAFLSEARGNPSLLLAWKPSDSISNTVVKDKVSWRLHLLTLMLIIMFLIIGFLYKADMTQWWQKYYQQEKPEVLITAIPVRQVNESLKMGVTKNKTQDAATELAPQVNTSALEKVNIEDAVTTQVKTDIKVAQPKNNIPAIMQSLTQVDKAVQVDKAIQDDVTNKKAPVVIKEKTKLPERAPVKIAKKVNLNGLWYLEQPDNHTVIQLLAVLHKEVSDEFIAKNNLYNRVHVYKTKRSNKTWWVVTLGSFKSLKEAKVTMNTLSVGTKKYQPFYKKINKIKQEIALLDQ